MAGQDAVADVEVGGHGLVVGDALGVVALDDALDDGRGLDGLLLDHLNRPECKFESDRKSFGMVYWVKER